MSNNMEQTIIYTEKIRNVSSGSYERRNIKEQNEMKLFKSKLYGNKEIGVHGTALPLCVEKTERSKCLLSQGGNEIRKVGSITAKMKGQGVNEKPKGLINNKPMSTGNKEKRKKKKEAQWKKL